MKEPIHVQQPVLVPVPGGKLIHEHLGRLAGGVSSLSIAQMNAPPGWMEPAQTPEFSEATLVLRGRLEVELPEGRRVLGAGETLLVPAGTRVRYANPFADHCEYVAVCMPAFSPETVHRES
jgi:mannose-6-phosphate isomerase-like protein (cupin superfamily)